VKILSPIFLSQGRPQTVYGRVWLGLDEVALGLYSKQIEGDIYQYMGKIKKSVRKAASIFPPVRYAVHAGMRLWTKPQLSNVYSHDCPSPATAFNIFKTEWSSAVPGFETGAISLFDDSRIKWLETQLGSFKNKRILELGPLEGGHTCMMERAGANVLAIEANQRGFLRCLVVKNALNLKSDFLYGDFRPYLDKAEPNSFDFVSAIGVLYHMIEPAKLLYDIARVTDAFGVWTHYFDPSILKDKVRFDFKPQFQTVAGRSVEVFRQHYLTGISAIRGYCGGTAPHSFWLTRHGLLEYVESLGFEVTVGQEDRNHSLGPNILFFAKRRQ
jgi:SAM-dependent methyltransferase